MKIDDLDINWATPRSADMLRQAMTDVPVTSTPIYVPVASIPLAKNPSDRYKSIDSGIDKIMAVLEKDYSEILEAYRQTGKFLYRGVNCNKEIFKANIRKNRTTVEMGPANQTILHKAFIRIGLKATRKNSIFCSTKAGI